MKCIFFGWRAYPKPDTTKMKTKEGAVKLPIIIAKNGLFIQQLIPKNRLLYYSLSQDFHFH